MKIYLSGAFDHRDDIRSIASALEAQGHVTTSHWVDEPPLVFDDTEFSLWERRARANDDVADVRRADVVVVIALWPSTTGGRYWEEGFAFGLGKRIIRVGPPENMFSLLADIEHFDTVDAFLQSTETRLTTAAHTARTVTSKVTGGVLNARVA